MADLPTPDNCPIMDKSGVCMCVPPKMCFDVDNESCFGMRSAFRYGQQITENKAFENISKIKGIIDKAFHDVGGECNQ